MAEGDIAAGRKIPDNRVLEAILVLKNSKARNDLSFDDTMERLEKAAEQDRLLILRSLDGWPNAFSIWSESRNSGPSHVVLEWFAAADGEAVSAMRALRHMHFFDRGILSYERTRAIGETFTRRWSPRSNRQHPASRRKTAKLRKQLKEHWDRRPYPGLYGGDQSDRQASVRSLHTKLASDLQTIPGGKYIICGGRTGDLVDELLTRSPAKILDIHALPVEYFNCACRFATSPEVSHHHGNLNTIDDDYEAFDGALILAVSRQAREWKKSLRDLSMRLKAGGRIVVADYFRIAKGKDSESDQHRELTEHEWLNAFELAGLEVLSFQDRTNDAVAAAEEIKLQFQNGSTDKLVAEKIKEIGQEKLAIEQGDLKWGIWITERKSKPLPSPTYHRNDTETVLVMLSGGLDSVYVLWDCLANTELNVVAHHISLLNRERREVPESQACREVIRWCNKNIRHVEYSESTIDRLALRFFGFDMFTVGFEAGLAAQHFRYQFNRHVKYWQIGHYKGEESWPGRWNFVDQCCRAASFPFKAPEFREIDIVSKAEQARRLPNELAALSWGCRRPVFANGIAEPCGECKTCRDRQAIGLS